MTSTWPRLLRPRGLPRASFLATRPHIVHTHAASWRHASASASARVLTPAPALAHTLTRRPLSQHAAAPDPRVYPSIASRGACTSYRLLSTARRDGADGTERSNAAAGAERSAGRNDTGNEDGAGAGEEPGAPPPRNLRALIREYGRIAVGVYLIVTSATFVACYTSIAYFGVDVAAIVSRVHWLKQLVGIEDEQAPVPSVEDAAGSVVSAAATSVSSNEGAANANAGPAAGGNRRTATAAAATTFLLAAAMSKMFIPVKLMLTAGITPVVARRLRAMGFEVGQKKLRDVRPPKKL